MNPSHRDRRLSHRPLALAVVVALTSLVGCRRASDATAPAAAGRADWAHGTWTYSEFRDGYAWIEFTPAPDGRSGAFTERLYNCNPGHTCTSAGTFTADAANLTLHSPRWRDRSFHVRTAGDVMEWVDHDIAIARLTLMPPPPAPPAGPAMPEFREPPVPPPDLRCEDMTAHQCWLVPRCTLDENPQWNPRYRCRDAAGPCEGHVAQYEINALRTDCNARSGCGFVPASCFCGCTVETRVPGPNPSCSCVCGGGQPAHCAATNAQ